MTRNLTLIAVAALLSLSFLAAPSAAQAQTFEAEIDCTGFFNPGDQVPYVMSFTNETNNTISLDVAVSLSSPMGDRTLFERVLNLGPNVVKDIPRRLNLPNAAPNGEWTLTITATSGAESTIDTCSFHVN